MTFAPSLQIVSDATDEQIAGLETSVDRACNAIARGRSGTHARIDILGGETEWTIGRDAERLVIVEPSSVWRLSESARRAQEAPLADLERLLSWIKAALTVRAYEPVRAVESTAQAVAWAAATVLSSEWSEASVSSHTPARAGRAVVNVDNHPRVAFLSPAVAAIHDALPTAVRLTRRSDIHWRLSPLEAEARNDDTAIAGLRAMRTLHAMPDADWFGTS